MRESSPVLHGFGQESLPTSGSIGSSGHPLGSEIKLEEKLIRSHYWTWIAWHHPLTSMRAIEMLAARAALLHDPSNVCTAYARH